VDETTTEKRLTALELAVAHLTEAVEEMVTSLDPAHRSLIESHLRDIRDNFNRLPSAVDGGTGE
jgi:hypothetical protein